MPIHYSRSNNHNHRHRTPNFPRESRPSGVLKLPMADINGKSINTIRDAFVLLEEHNERRARTMEELDRLKTFFNRVIAHDGMRHLLLSIYGVGDLTQKQLARMLIEDPARISTRLKEFRRTVKDFALAHPLWIAELAPRHQRMILGRKDRNGSAW